MQTSILNHFMHSHTCLKAIVWGFDTKNNRLIWIKFHRDSSTDIRIIDSHAKLDVLDNLLEGSCGSWTMFERLVSVNDAHSGVS